MNYVKDFALRLKNSKKLRYTIRIITRDNKELSNIDFIEIKQSLAIWILRAESDKVPYIREEILKIISAIYTDHLKYKLTNTSYPVYNINYIKDNIIVELIGFRKSDNNLTEFVTPNYVDSINIQNNVFDEDDTNEVMRQLKSFRLNNGVRLVSCLNSDNYQLLNIENISELNVNAVIKVVRQASKYNGGKLEFNQIKYIVNEGIYDFTSIFKIVFNDGCELGNIGDRWIQSFKNLREIKLCDSIKYIGNLNIEDFITHQSGKNYLNIYGKSIEIIGEL